MNVKRVLLLLVVAFAAFTTYRYYSEDLSQFEQDRASAPGKFLQTDTGTMRYQVFGQANEPVIILVHSFNGFIETWNPNVASLVDQGYRVVAYDLWGRGFSDRPRIDLTLDVFSTQLSDLIDHLGVVQVTLVGSSFGSVIASDFALRFPDRVKAVVMLGPAGWPSDGFDKTAILDVPILGDTIFHYRGVALTRSAVDAYFYNASGQQWVVDLWDQFANYPGFTRSALATLRHAPVRDYSAGWRALGQSDVPVLVVWGKQDVSFPYRNAELMQAYVPQATVIGLEYAAHWVNIEQSAKVNQLVIEFLPSVQSNRAHRD